MSKSTTLKFMSEYKNQLKDISPFINISALAKATGIDRTTLWRNLTGVNDKTKLDFEVLGKLEDLGILRRPVEIKVVM